MRPATAWQLRPLVTSISSAVRGVGAVGGRKISTLTRNENTFGVQVAGARLRRDFGAAAVRRVDERNFHGGRSAMDKKGEDDDVTVEIEEVDAPAQGDGGSVKEAKGEAKFVANAEADEGAEEVEGEEKVNKMPVGIKERIKYFAEIGIQNVKPEDLKGVETLSLSEILEALGDEDGSPDVYHEPGTHKYLLGDLEDDDNAPLAQTFEEEIIFPRLSEDSKENMYRLHMEDPKKNSVDALAKSFGVAPLRVTAILSCERTSSSLRDLTMP